MSSSSPHEAWRSRGWLRQALANPSQRMQDGLGQFFEDVEDAHLVRNRRKDFGQRFGVQRRAIGRDSTDDPAAIRNGLPEPAEEAANILVAGGVVEDFKQQLGS